MVVERTLLRERQSSAACESRRGPSNVRHCHFDLEMTLSDHGEVHLGETVGGMSDSLSVRGRRIGRRGGGKVVVSARRIRRQWSHGAYLEVIRGGVVLSEELDSSQHDLAGLLRHIRHKAHIVSRRVSSHCGGFECLQ